MANGEPPKPACFVIMPISDVDGYDAGHFGRVYEFIVKPACRNAGFKPVRADEVQVTNYIVVDILRKILDADMVVCDLSARNSNVLYELGIRQAFNKPVTLIRDSKTPRIFDIQGLRDLEYDEGLRIDKINIAVESLSNLLKNTSRLTDRDVNSVIQLLGVKPAQISSVEISEDTSLLLNAIGDIGKRLSRLEDLSDNDPFGPPPQRNIRLAETTIGLPSILLQKGVSVDHPKFGEGVVTSATAKQVTIDFDSGPEVTIPIDSSELRLLQPPLEIK